MITLTGSTLTLKEVGRVIYENEIVEASFESMRRVDESRRAVEEIVAGERVVYGITTGFGKFSDVLVRKEDTEELQLNLIRSHACGVGELFSEEVSRAMLLLRANTLLKGFSGARRLLVETLIKMINSRIHPVIPQQGSLGASGDLVPLAHLALAIIGEGEVFYKGKRCHSLEALKAEGIEPITLQAKEGLALINGTQAMTAMGAVAFIEAEKMACQAELVASLTMEGLQGIIDAFDEDVHTARGYVEQVEVARRMRKILQGSRLTTRQGELRVQDAYSLRCIPQVFGATRQTLSYVYEKLEIEINAATDNPLIFDGGEKVISGGNFHGQPIAFAMDFLKIAMAELANISERRIERLVNPQLNDLPAFLSPEPGLQTGAMILQYCAASLVSENKTLAHPASVDSIPSSANQEDHVSMGTIAARHAYQIIGNVRKVIAIELICALQACEFRGTDKMAPITNRLYRSGREIVPSITKDRVFSGDIENVRKWMAEGDWDCYFCSNENDLVGSLELCENKHTEELAEELTKCGVEFSTCIKPDEYAGISMELPLMPEFIPGIRRAPDRGFRLTKAQTETALKNALRYVPKELHEKLAPEFMEELVKYGRIYAYRYRPEGRIYGKSIEEYKGRCLEGKAFQVMIDNNLDFETALYPYELVTYGETGQVCQNWLQYRLIKKYLQDMTQEQTLVIESGHPLGLFPSKPDAPRVIITNALMVGMFDNQKDWEIAAQMGVANYGQMTAGGWMYIGPQGIVHGTYNTLLTAGRLKLCTPKDGDLRGRLFVSSGLGGMSGAQPKAIEIANGVGIIAEVDYSRISTRYEQGWVGIISDKPEEAFDIAEEHMKSGQTISIAYHGNIVDLLQYAVTHGKHIDLLSDQTSCHAVYDGGYCPQGISFEERTRLLAADRKKFKELVDRSLRLHFEAIKALTEKGTYFFDYGNSFMKAMFDAGVIEISKNGRDEKDGFVFPSYVEDIMGPELFDYGYGPFRWVCLSGSDEDLRKTDIAAMSCIDHERRGQDRDNYNWIRDAEKNRLVVGTKARILYQDAEGRTRIALKFNEMVRNGEIGPVMLGRDHHDVSGTDSPFRETANIKDGSNVMADMATQCFAGNAARGMSLVALHNGGGVGIGKAINGGFGLVLDGSSRVDEIIRSAMMWDVMGGVARRSWARNSSSIETCLEYNKKYQNAGHITIPNIPDDALIKEIVSRVFDKGDNLQEV